jgi:hypothetical protein
MPPLPSSRDPARSDTGRAPVRGPADALEAFASVADLDVPQILALLLDDDCTGNTCVAVDHAVDADAVLRVGDLLAELAAHDIGLSAAVLASVRPRGGVELADVDRWEALSARLAGAQVQLLEWFILGDAAPVGVAEITGAPWRWRDVDPAGGKRLADGSTPPIRAVTHYRQAWKESG